MSVQGICAQCGDPIPPRPDPRGRRAKYCSDACRAAASRQRAQQRHAAELEAARSQMAIELRQPSEIISEVIQELNAAARIIEDRGQVPSSLKPMLEAARRMVRASEQKPQTTSRRSRRRAVRKSGQ